MLRFTVVAIFFAVTTISLVPGFVQTTNEPRRLTNTTDQSLNLNPILTDDGAFVVFESTSDLAAVGGSSAFHTIRARVNTESINFQDIATSRAYVPSVSSDGQKIAFSSTEDLVGENPDRNYEIYYFNGSQLQQLTHTNADTEASRITDGNFTPSISSDGHWIAFSSNRNLTSAANLEIFLCDTIRKSCSQLTDSDSGIRLKDPKLSGDGNSLYYIRTRPGTEGFADLVFYNLPDHSRRVLSASLEGLAVTPGRAVSRDGNRIVYSAGTSTNQSQVFLFDLRDTAPRQLTQLGTRNSDVSLNATISGDGTRVAFATRRKVTTSSDGSVELYLLDLPTGLTQQITNAPSNATGDVISSLNLDGSAVAFSFPRVLSETVVDSELSNNPEIYFATLAARPAFGQATVANAATRNFEELRIAPGSIAVIRGNQLSSGQEQAKLIQGNLPSAIRGTRVLVNGETARLFYVSSAEVVFVVPPELVDGAAEVTVFNSEGFPSKAPAIISRTAPGVFSFEDRGILLNTETLVAGPFDPAAGDLRLTVFATGVRNATDLSATFAGLPVGVEGIFPSSLPGLDEIHLRLPTLLSGAGPVPVALKTNDFNSNTVMTVISGSSLRDIMINEILADPPDGLTGDANHDGIRDSSADEFVELVNATTRDLDLSGYELQTRSLSSTSDTLRHRFANGTVLPAGTALVVFGGGTVDSSNPIFGGSKILKASANSLSLSNSGGVVTLRDPTGAAISFLSYGAGFSLPGDANQSITRSPDITGNLLLHQAAPGTKLFSPGTKVDGQRFSPSPPVLSILVSPSTAQLLRGEQLQFSARAFDEGSHDLAGVIFSWHSSNQSVVVIDSNGMAKAVGPGSSEVTATGRGVESLPAVVSVVDPTPTPTPTPTPASSPTPSPNPSPASRVVISEFRTRGPNGSSDEFVEFYNNSEVPVDLSGWKLRVSSSTGAISNRLIFSAGTVIPPRQHLLVVNSTGYSGQVASDQRFSSGIANDGGIALTLPSDAVVDQVGMSPGSAFHEGMHLAPLPGDANQSYERKPGGFFGSTQDTSDNFTDFQLTTPSAPQNLGSAPTPGISPTPTPSPTTIPTPTLTASPTPSTSPTPGPNPSPISTLFPVPALPPLLISEFRTRGSAGASDEFIEICNNTDTQMSAAGLMIRGSSSTGSITTRSTPTLRTPRTTSTAVHGCALAMPPISIAILLWLCRRGSRFWKASMRNCMTLVARSQRSHRKNRAVVHSRHAHARPGH